jgi:Spy/CpxP family protein refolding chaperone
MKRKWMIAGGVVAAIVVATAALGYARALRHRHDGLGFFGHRGLMEMEVRLKLTPEQSKQVREILKSAREKGFDQFAGGSGARVALAKAVFSPQPNQAEIQKNIMALEQQHQQMLQLVVNTGQQISQVLTPEQRAEMQKIIDEKAQIAAKRREHFRQRMKERMGDTTPAPQP